MVPSRWTRRKQGDQEEIRSVRLLWIEKLWLLVDIFQLYGVLWNISLAWPWPRIWLRWTRWTVWTNLDVLSGSPAHTFVGQSNSGRSRWGEWEGYFEYAAIIAVIPFVCALLGAITIRYCPLSNRCAIFLPIIQ